MFKEDIEELLKALAKERKLFWSFLGEFGHQP